MEEYDNLELDREARFKRLIKNVKELGDKTKQLKQDVKEISDDLNKPRGEVNVP